MNLYCKASPNAKIRRITWAFLGIDILLALLAASPLLIGRNPSIGTVLVVVANFAITGLGMWSDLHPHRLFLFYLQVRVGLRRKP